jgi:hypothetical protein
MSSQPTREEERRVNIRTLAIASIASAAAAVITSQFWIQGTWMAAAITPVIVALVSEMLHRPTAVIAEKVTTRTPSVLPATGGPADPRREAEQPAPAEPGSQGGPAAPPVRVYRSGGDKPVRPRAGRRKIAIGVVAVTAVLAFAITAFAITGTELLAGGSIGKGSGRTTLFSKDDSKKSGESPEQEGTQPGESAPQQDAPESGSDGRGQPEPQQEQPSQEPAPQDQAEPAPEVPESQVPQEQQQP